MKSHEWQLLAGVAGKLVGLGEGFGHRQPGDRGCWDQKSV